MDLRLLIFDCDGVLIDSEPVTARAQADLLTRFGYVVSAEDMIRRFTGVSERDMYATIEGELGRALPDAFHDEAGDAVAEAFRTDLTATAGIHEVIGTIKVPISVASNSPPYQLRLGLELVGLYDAFTPNVFSASEVRSGKPAPDLFFHVADRMGVRPDCCLVIEDSMSGVAAARAAGMPVIGFAGGTHCPPGHQRRLSDAGAVLTFTEMRQLPGLMSKLVSSR